MDQQTHPRRGSRGRRVGSRRNRPAGRMSPLWTLEAIERRVMLDATGTFTGTYFNNSDLTVPVVTQSDPQINFDWGKGSPASGVDPSTFSVRWTGKIKPAFSETYTFTTTADDGVRLWVNGQLI